MQRALYATAFLRALATSALGVLLGMYLAQRGLSIVEVGQVISAGLAGTAAAAGLVTFWGSRLSPRGVLLVASALSAAGLLALAWLSAPPLLLLAAFVGMANGMGRDRGAALIVEQALLPAMTTDRERTRTMAWYTMLQDVGHALGALVPGAVAALSPSPARPAVAGSLTLVVLAALSLVGLVVYAWLRLDALDARPGKVLISPRSRVILAKLCGLFALDALGSGFLTTALVSYFFFERFGVGLSIIGPLFFGARLMNALSHLLAAKLADRIGLVNTMVFTHIPSSLLLVTVAFAPTLWVAIALFLLREGLVEMDVPTRQSYVLAVVEPGERTFASGITNLVRLAAWAVAPGLAGLLMQGSRLYLPLVLGASMKITYDLALWRAFRSLKPPEERSATP